MISVSYTNNIERHEPRIIDEYTTTPSSSWSRPASAWATTTCRSTVCP